MEVEHTQDLGITNLYLANTGKKGYAQVVGRRGKPILGFPLKLFWGKCPAGMTYHLKEGNMSWNC